MITLFSTFFLSKDSNRQKELFLCLQKNNENSLIKNIFLFLDGKADKEIKEYITSNLTDINKLTFIELGSIPTYGDWILNSKNYILDLEEISVFINADIYVDNTISKLKDYTAKSETIVCLSRHDLNDLNEHVPHPNPQWSQDLWAVSKENILKINNQCFIDELTITRTGMYRCDNKLAYIFAMRGWEIYNPYSDVKCYHVQKDISRDYGKFDVDIVGGLCFVSTTDSPDKPSELDISVMPVKVGKITKCVINKYLQKNLFPETNTNFVSSVKNTAVATKLCTNNQLENNTIPIVIVCKNGIKQNTIEITEQAVKQAVYFKNKVHLISDFLINFESEYFTQHNIEKFYSKEYLLFNENYVNLNTLSYDLVQVWFNRHIILNNFMHKNNLQSIFHIDYDVLIYCNIQEIKHNFIHFDFTLSRHRCSHNSYFTLNMHDDLIKILIDMYSLKEQHFLFRDFNRIFNDMQKLNKTGGIDDMTLLNHFTTRKECNNKFTCGEMMDIINDTTFDYYIKHTEDYEIASTLPIKNIIFKEGLPHCYNTTLNKLIQFNSLHFQGKYKELMKDYITYK